MLVLIEPFCSFLGEKLGKMNLAIFQGPTNFIFCLSNLNNYVNFHICLSFHVFHFCLSQNQLNF